MLLMDKLLAVKIENGTLRGPFQNICHLYDATRLKARK